MGRPHLQILIEFHHHKFQLDQVLFPAESCYLLRVRSHFLISNTNLLLASLGHADTVIQLKHLSFHPHVYLQMLS